jgi:hypothetical protein
VLRRFAYHSRQTVRRLARRALDAIDPPEPQAQPVSMASAPLTIQPEPTPNPLATRYGLSRSLGMVDGHTPLGRRLGKIPGVVSVYGTHDFVSITRAGDADKEAVEQAVLAILRSA